MGTQVLTDRENYENIAAAIRTKLGTTTNYKPPDMAEAILSISGGTDTSDATATAADILSPKTAYVASGKVTGTIATVQQATPTIIYNTDGLITATATQTSGFIGSGSKSSTLQLPTQDAQIIVPTKTNQIIQSGKFLTGNLTIAGDANLEENNIRKDTILFGVKGTLEEGTPGEFFNIAATVEPSGSGTVSGMGQCTVGMNVTVTEIPTDGYFFTGWNLDGETVSQKESYSFPVYNNTSLTAQFHKYEFIMFSSDSEFTLEIANSQKRWDGVIEYSTDTITWNEWVGSNALSSSNGKLYLRGTGNTIITGTTANPNNIRWKLTGENISCTGNIETLLDYATVSNNEHPQAADSCFAYMFYQNDAIINAPKIGLTTLSAYCCYDMFSSCTNLVNASSICAENIGNYACDEMYRSCTSLVTIPKLRATSLARGCYMRMFSLCSKIKISEVQTDEYKYPVRIPSDGTGTENTSSLTQMFYGTGGTFTGDPSINTTYYTSNTIVE